MTRHFFGSSLQYSPNSPFDDMIRLLCRESNYSRLSVLIALDDLPVFSWMSVSCGPRTHLPLRHSDLSCVSCFTVFSLRTPTNPSTILASGKTRGRTIGLNLLQLERSIVEKSVVIVRCDISERSIEERRRKVYGIAVLEYAAA